MEREWEENRKTSFFLSSHNLIFFSKGIAPITVVTHRDTLEEEEEKDALDEASAATGSSISHTFFVTNYTQKNKARNPEIEKMAFDILDCALMNAERAVKIMIQKEKNKAVGMFEDCIFIQGQKNLVQSLFVATAFKFTLVFYDNFRSF